MTTTPTTAPITVEVFESLSEARDLSSEWSLLMDSALDAEPFLTPEWNLTWWQAFGSGRMKLLAIRHSDELIGVAPLRIVEQRVDGRRRPVLTFWANAFSNRSNLILSQEHASEAARSVVESLHRDVGDWHVARLGPLLKNAQTTRLFTEALEDHGSTWGFREAHASPYIALPGSWEDLEGQLSKSYRESLRRKIREAEATEGVSYHSGGNAAADADDAFEISRHTWQHDAGTGIASRSDIESFYRSLAEKAAARGWLQVAYLQVDGTPVSYEFNLAYCNTVYNLKLGYRKDYRKLSPGTVLKKKVLQQAIDEGRSVYDLLGQAEPYKMHWTDKTRRLANLWVHRRGLLPRATHIAYFTVRPFIQRRMPWLLDLKRKLWS